MSASPQSRERSPSHDFARGATLSFRKNVRAAAIVLGTGLLTSADQTRVRAWFAEASLTPESYYGGVLRALYRLIFLLLAESRDLLHPRGVAPQVRSLYDKARSFTRVAHLDENTLHDPRLNLWRDTNEVFLALSIGAPELGLAPLGGLFAVKEHPIFATATLSNHTLFRVARLLNVVTCDRGTSPVPWATMPGEELGSLYEQLLGLRPEIELDAMAFQLTDTMGGATARRSSGSYYTPPELVEAVTQDTLTRCMTDLLKHHPDSPREALQRLKVVDPACGCGHFLLAAARLIAKHLEPHLRSDDETPSSLHALRLVITNCIYGVDLNPTAIELCKVNLWLEAAQPAQPLSFLDAHLKQGNALLGAPTAALTAGLPSETWSVTDKTARRQLKRRTLATNDARACKAGKLAPAHAQTMTDVWCAAFFWPLSSPEAVAAAPTPEVWADLLSGNLNTHRLTLELTSELAGRHSFFHWHLRFPEVFQAGGFDVVLGNPPWIAHAGRAAQPLEAGVKHFYERNYSAFAKYITTHGLFASVLPRVLRPGGYLGFVLPSSLSELAGYEPTRKAHDELCALVSELTDFGEGRFEGVTQPCMALVTKRDADGRTDAVRGAPWPVARPDLSKAERDLLHYLCTLPTVPPGLFAERGLQSDAKLRVHFTASAHPVDRFTVPVREGTDVREFTLLPPRFHVDPQALGKRLRAAVEFQQVGVVVRQTARYPIAALSDGTAFRNSLLACLTHDQWSAHAMVALLNSTLVRWHHYMRFRDARQPVLPQVKISHLRALPAPPNTSATFSADLARLGASLSGTSHAHMHKDLRLELDREVTRAYGLTAAQMKLLQQWRYA
jgi:hypothetical protein